MILKLLTSLAAPGGARSRLSVFYFHRVPATADPLLPGEPDAAKFDSILGWIGAQFRVLDPMDACERLYAGTLPARPAIISFDDGYRDNYDVALPLLRRHRMQAMFFVATGFLDGSMMFNDRIIEAVRACRHEVLKTPLFSQSEPEGLPLRSGTERRTAIQRILDSIKRLPPPERLQRVIEVEHVVGAAALTGRLMMNPEEVAALHGAGMRIGGHTRTHPILRALADVDAEREIAGGLDDLASIVGERPMLFAYPNGKHGQDFDSRHVAMVAKLGCRFAFTTESGAATRSSGRHELPRFTPWDRTHARFGLRAWRNLARREQEPSSRSAN